MASLAMKRDGPRPASREPTPRRPPMLQKAEEDWRKSRGEKRFAKQLSFHAEQLKIEIVRALEQALEKETYTRDDAIDEITRFLRDDDNKNKIDGCIRWLILFILIKSDAEDAEALILKVLVSINPYLAFENPYQPVYYEQSPYKPVSQDRYASEVSVTWRNECKDISGHWQQKTKSTPFHKAAASGNAKAVQQMICCLDEYCKTTLQRKLSCPRPLFKYSIPKEEPVLWTLRLPDPSSSIRETALQLAAKADNGKLETLDVLLAYPGIAGPNDMTFVNSLDNGIVEVVGKFLEHEELRRRFVTSDNIIRAMGKIPQQSTVDMMSDENSKKKIVYSLIKYAENCEVFNVTVMKKIIELNLQRAWTERHHGVQLDTSCLIHLAVFHQNLDFVKVFLRDYPDSVTTKATIPDTDGHSYYALWYNNRTWDSSKSKWLERSGSPEIRTEVVTSIVRRIEKMQALSEILQQSAEEVRELCFDISLFDSKSYRLKDFVKSLINHRENETLLSYEPTIKYARFPVMDLHPAEKKSFGEVVYEDCREVFDVLDWLKKTKNVNSVIELKVPDRLVNPHNERHIAKYVKEFSVEILDWRFIDLSLSVFDKDKVKPKIRGLHLYASGKWAVISHWFSSEGLESFANETMTKANSEKFCRYVRKELKNLKRRLQPRKLDSSVNLQPWNPTHESLADLEELAQRAFPKLSQFILSYRAMTLNSRVERFSPTKIAIIDNGIMSMSPTSYDSPRNQKRQKSTKHTRTENTAALGGLTNQEEKAKRNGQDSEQDANTSATETDDDDDNDWGRDPNRRDRTKGHQTLWSRIEQGRSFVDDDFQLSPWLFASDPHGTQMANLICAIDPACRLYVAKVTDGRYGITPHRVARAIQWARDQKVDIICMSFAILETSEFLDTTISAANADGIVLLCSTHDQGSNVSKAWPADSAETITVTACDEYGALPRPTNEDKYKHKLHGFNVAAGAIPFLESTDRVSGSSVATAIATGLSSLILSCLRLANDNRLPLTGMRRKTEVEKHLNAMHSSEGSKYVLLEKFGHIDAKIKDGEPINAEVILNQVFKTREN
ncbi:hypothetical protein F4775DRAFT_596851 [Biscogniauxia sp. FL1348]|nr:hypothetical protein F4775DRAFT_596851 [Biscogniauxia sp. FL1348]